jgi:hypothetical protein
MKNLLISLSLLLVLITFGTLVFMDTAGAQNNLVGDLLDLPAPPPPNPLFRGPVQPHNENFYDKKNPPGDDAPIGDLIEYWQTQSTNYADLGYNLEPSRETMERLLEAIKDKPELLGSLINIFPENAETADFVKKIYDAGGTEGEEGGLNETIEAWLKYHSKYYADELLEGSRQVGDADEYVTNQEELLALTRVDFSRAQPILNQLYNDSRQPVSQTLARWALYRHAIDTDSLGDIERYRDELKATVENRQATPGMRDLAMDALIKEKDWSGREDWYMGLLEDETLADLQVNGRSYTGLTTIVLLAPPEKYMDRMLGLLKSSTPAVRNAAVKNLALLISKDSPEVVRALLPWLEDPKWAKEAGGERSRLVEALQSLSMPESVPGLINIMEELKTVKRPSGMANSNTAFPPISLEDGEPELPMEVYRISAITALGTQKDARAIPALRRALNEVDEYERAGTIKALLQSHGFSVGEQVDALETVAKSGGETVSGGSINANVKMPGNYTYGVPDPINTDDPQPPPPLPPGKVFTAMNSNANTAYIPKRPVTPEEIKVILGGQLVENQEADEALVAGVVDRIAALDRRDPPTAAKLRSILQNWNGPAINAMLLRELETGKATLDSVVKLLSLRKEFMEKQSTAVYDARDGSPLAFGITACILNNNNEYDAILAGENVESKIAMLACARLVRADLPVNKTAEYLGSTNKMLSLAAERYLESNDSPQARASVLALHPNEARIMGATTFSAPGDAEPTESEFLTPLFASLPGGLSMDIYYMSSDYAGDIKKTERRLQKEVRENNDLLGVYAYDDNFIRIYKDKTVFSWEEDTARYHERALTENEFDNFKNFLASSGVDTLPPFLSEPTEEEQETASEELLMLGPQGGRRVFLESPTKPQFFKDLDAAFEEMRKPPAKLHYWLEKDFQGLEILFSDDDLKAVAVWKNGADMRVLVENQKQREEIDKELDALYSAESAKEDFDYEEGEKVNRQRRLQRQYEHLSWRKFAGGNVAAGAAQPAEIQAIPMRDGLAVEPSDTPWRTRSAGIEVRANNEGLYKVSQGQLTKLRSGFYYEPVIVPGGRWAMSTKLEAGTQLMRVNLLTGKEFRVEIPGFPYVRTAAYVPSVKRVLVAAAGYYGDADDNNRTTWFLLDPETGAFQLAKGEFIPLTQQVMRPLQAASAPDEFWAAIPNTEKTETQIGIYNARSFIFKPLQKVSKITFSSMDMWVDEKESKIYLVYAGHLLALPLKK